MVATLVWIRTTIGPCRRVLGAPDLDPFMLTRNSNVPIGESCYRGGMSRQSARKWMGSGGAGAVRTCSCLITRVAVAAPFTHASLPLRAFPRRVRDERSGSSSRSGAAFNARASAGGCARRRFHCSMNSSVHRGYDRRDAADLGPPQPAGQQPDVTTRPDASTVRLLRTAILAAISSELVRRGALLLGKRSAVGCTYRAPALWPVAAGSNGPKVLASGLLVSTFELSNI